MSSSPRTEQEAQYRPLRQNLPDIPDNKKQWIRPTFGEIPKFEDAFKQWATDHGRADNTISWYWNVIKNTPFVGFTAEDQYEIAGTLNKHLNSSSYKSKKNVKTALSALLDFLLKLHEHELTGREYEIHRQKRNSIKTNLEVETSSNKGGVIEEETVKDNYIHPDHLIEMLRKAEPDRARFWYLLYATGMRIGELKRTTPDHLNPEREQYGIVYVPEGRGDGRKSPQSRDVELLSETPLKVFDNAPRGDWTDRNDNTWENVYFPDYTSQTEYYHLKQKICSEIKTIDGRTVHSFRHSRISHLVNDPQIVPHPDVKEFVQKRSGHSTADTTDCYIATTYERDPITLETYCDEHDIDVLQVIGQ